MSKATFSTLSARTKELNKWAHSLPKGVDPYETSDWERGYERAQVEFADKLRKIMSSLPKGFNLPNPSLKTQAKARFLQWRENQAKGEWKTLTEAEQAVWEGYVSEGVEFGEIRVRELARDEPVKAGDRVVLVSDVQYLGDEWPKGSAGEVRFIVHDGVTDLDMCLIDFDLDLYSLNVHMHEIKKES